jgi:hypothetical protein
MQYYRYTSRKNKTPQIVTKAKVKTQDCMKTLNLIHRGKKDELIRYIVDDKMSISAASKKENMSKTAGRRSYHRCLKARNMDSPIGKYTQDQINQLIGYIVGNKMAITTAAKKSKYV